MFLIQCTAFSASCGCSHPHLEDDADDRNKRPQQYGKQVNKDDCFPLTGLLDSTEPIRGQVIHLVAHEAYSYGYADNEVECYQ